jgi:hypothetical protein
VQIRTPPIDEVARRWAEIEPILRRCTEAEGRLYEPVDLLAMAMSGQVGLWLIEDGSLVAVAVCSVKVYPRKKVFDINYIVGARAKEWWADFMAEAERKAREFGCTHVISSAARPGWERFSARLGIKLRIAGMTFVRDLEGG